MRTILRLFTALPLRSGGSGRGVPTDRRAADGAAVDAVAWAWTPVVGVLIGVVWFVVHQLTLSGVGPLVAATSVLGVAAALTGARGHRGLAAVARAAPSRAVPAGPPAEGTGTVAVVLAVVAQVTLLQRVTLAPAAIVVVPMVARTVQVLLLRQGDGEVGVPPPTAAQRIAVGLLSVLLLAVPAAVVSLERPIRLDGPLAGMEFVLLGVGSLVAALAVGALARGWLLARFGDLDAAGWHTIGLLGEVAALAVVAVRIG